MSFAAAQISPPAFNDRWVDEDGRLTAENTSWFLQSLLPALQQAPSLSGASPAFEADNQNAAIAATPLPLGTLSTGRYRVSIFLRVSSPDGVNSSVAPVLNFTTETVACQITGAALTSDNIGLPQSAVFLVSVDQPGPIEFSTTYASNTPNAMHYTVTVLTERMS